MASSLQVPIALSGYPKRTFRCRTVCKSANFPMPPLNPQDPFLKRLASAASSLPDPKLPVTPDNFPFLDLMASSAAGERSVTYNEHRPRRPPPDLPSLMLHGRIVFIGMPLVPAVSELIIAELLYLEYMDPTAPINLYINSTGTTRDDGEVVAMESEGFAIYDILMHVKNDIHTLCLGTALGHACLLLAAGKKGKRFMLPSSQAMIQQPQVTPSGLMQASDALIRAKEVVSNRDMFIKLMAKHTGNSEEKVAKCMNTPYYMDAAKAIEFGVVDKVLKKEIQTDLSGDFTSSEEWDRRAGVNRDPF